MQRVGADTGGTFTDVVAADGTIAKVPSTPADPGEAVRTGVSAVGGAALLAHGTTVATNALLERTGARVALVTTAGLADVIEIARQDRPSLYDIDVVRPDPLVARSDRHEVEGRLAADGSELAPVGAAPSVGDGVEAVAVCLLHADLCADHEAAVAGELRAR
ncbi:MAG TPA: hydantoinase/oxoprolinase N-terminal domain-containing protein, partial [Acidimicrobiales bacterium]|nr:hydantoinase/oxoprolinase N-terminal domain-containing protein [Acidimicrobiales bacterium]